ncbi:MAG: leucine-rich repeat domain-containing protein [Holosporaceae bacterium]|nr:leucine-rich repeat domain-containing protein [Holosporaceae bacterium]
MARLWFPNDLGPAVNFAVRFAHKHETLVSVAVEYKARFRSLWLDDRGKNGPEHLGVPASVSHLAQGGFAEYSRLRTVNFENGSALQELPAACFRGSGLSELHLPPGVIKLGYRSLAECRNLRFFSAEQGSTLTEIGPEAFRLSGLETLRLPDSVADIGEQAFADCPNLEELKFGANSRLRKLEDGAFKKCTALRLVNIPGRVTDLGEGCFRDCTALYQVKFDRRDETRPFPCRSLWIHSYAFSNTGLRYFQVPYYARQTGNGQFARCRKLDCIEFEPDPYGKGPIWDAAKMRSR